MWESFFWTAFTIFVLDQSIKFFISNLGFPFYLNKRGTLGVYKKYPKLRYFAWVFHLVIFLSLFFLDVSNTKIFLGAGLITGGLSNAFDRRIRGGVIDFLPLPFSIPNQPHPARANIADFAIIVGSVVYIFGVLDLWK